MANGILNCYLFEKSVDEVITFRISQFTDFTDVYTSFLFNLLSQSLQIKNLATTMATAQTNSNWALFVESLAKLIRIIMDFESSNAMGFPDLSSILEPLEVDEMAVEEKAIQVKENIRLQSQKYGKQISEVQTVVDGFIKRFENLVS